MPGGDDCIHEIKYDGFRVRLERDGKRVRVSTRNGHDWTDRFPFIVEAAHKLRRSQFIVDGRAVVLGVDGITDFVGCARATRRAGSKVRPYQSLDRAEGA